MGRKGQGPPPNLRRLPPGAGLVYPDSFGPPMCNPSPGDFPHFDRPPPGEKNESF